MNKKLRKVIIMLACFGLLFQPVNIHADDAKATWRCKKNICSLPFTGWLVNNKKPGNLTIKGNGMNLTGKAVFIAQFYNYVYVYVVSKTKPTSDTGFTITSDAETAQSIGTVATDGNGNYNKVLGYYYSYKSFNSYQLSDYSAITENYYQNDARVKDLIEKYLPHPENGLLINKSYNLKKGDTNSQNIDTWHWNRSYDSKGNNWQEYDEIPTVEFQVLASNWQGSSKSDTLSQSVTRAIIDNTNVANIGSVSATSGKFSVEWSDVIEKLKITGSLFDAISASSDQGNIYYWKGWKVRYRMNYGDGTSAWHYISNTMGASPKTSKSITDSKTYNSTVINNFYNVVNETQPVGTDTEPEETEGSSITYNNQTYITNNNSGSSGDDSGSNLWDFLIQLVQSLGDVITTAINGLGDILNNLLGMFGDLFGWLSEQLERIVIPSSEQWKEINTKKAEIKEKTGFIGQSTGIITDCLTDVSNHLKEEPLVFTWNDFSLFDHVIISSGSFDLAVFDENSAFSAVHKTIKTVIDTFLILGVVLLTYRKLKEVLYS